MSESVLQVQLLSKASGYGILVGVGALFALGIVIATKLAARYLHEDSQSTEMFMVANRSVGVGLTASAVYSSWTWATELLWAVTMVYNYGVMAAFWYGAGLSVQICLMSILGIEAKKKIPASHTSLEIVELRYGKVCHLLYMFLCLVNNLLSCSAMILGAAGAISVICGDLNIVASTMLIPFGVLLYTTVGGLKSTFLTDYVHSFIVLVVLCYLNTAVLKSTEIGGLDGLYNLVIKHDGDRYIDGNYMGSFLTGKSQGAVIFGIIHAIGDTGLTVMDSSFWQKSFSANLNASVPGYLLAALTVFSNPWTLGTVVGLAAVVLESSPIFPTYPRKMTTYEINSGFALPYTLKALLGDSALGAIALIVFLAVTSTVSAQMISVSSIMSFDIYKRYIKPEATNSQIIRISHFGVVFFGLFSAGFSVMLHYVGVDMTWFGYFYSMVICPGVMPLILSITWSRQTKLAFFISPIIGMIIGITVWLTTAYRLYGEVTVASTGKQLPCLYGGLTTIVLPGIISVIVSLTINPCKFDWNKFKEAKLIINDNFETESSSINENSFGNGNEKDLSEKDLSEKEIIVEEDYISEELLSDTISKNERKIKLYIKLAYGAAIFTLLLTWIVWPLPLYRDYIWSKAFFKGWTTVSIMWVYMSFLIIGIFPIYDGRHSLAKVFKGVYKDFIARKKI